MGKRIGFLLLIIFFILSVSATAKEYTVQVSAFQDETEAESLVYKLRDKDYPAYYIRVDLGKKGIWFRVRIGRFSTESKVVQFSKDFKATEKLDYFITVFQTPENSDYKILLNGSSPETETDPIKEDYPETVPDSILYTPTMLFVDSTDTSNDAIITNNETGSLPVINSETSNYSVKTSSGNDTQVMILSLNEVISMKTSEQDLKEKYKEFLADMDYGDKIYVKSRQGNNRVDLHRAYEVYKKIVSDYFYLKEVYKAKYKMALCLRDLRLYNDAIQILKNIIPEVPPKEAALIQYEIGFMYYHNLKEYNKALDELEKVLVHYPDSPWAREAKDLMDTIMTYKIYVVEDDFEEQKNDKNGD